MSKSPKRMLILGTVVKWLGKTEGRDKLCKMIQFSCLLLSRIFKDDDYYNLQFQTLYQSFKQARKLFRLFKSLIEYQKLIAILLDDRDNWPKFFRVIAQICFFFYWFFDNISIACKVKIIKGNHMKINTVAAFFWFLSLAISVPVLIQESRNNPDPAERKKQILDAIKYSFDLLPSSKQSRVLQKLMNIEVNVELQAIGGLVSGIISTYQVIQESSKF